MSYKTNPSAASNADAAANALFNVNVRKVVSIQAARLIRTGVFPDHMREDLEQELLVILHNESRNFDPEKSSFSTFAKRVLANRSQNYIRNVLTAARHNGEYGIENISIYERVGSDGKIVGDFINFDEVRIQMGYQSRSEREMKELRECIHLALSRLPVASREICLAILRGETVSSLAKAHGMDVSWFRAKYLSSLRPIFIDAEINGF